MRQQGRHDYQQAIDGTLVPMSYLRQWRFEMARNWLRDTDQTMAGIAERLGYESEASFSRAFKKTTGQTPGSVRREKND